MPSHQDVCRIDEVAGQADVPAKTIRFWEEHGLVPPPTRTASGYREVRIAELIATREHLVGLAHREQSRVQRTAGSSARFSPEP